MRLAGFAEWWWSKGVVVAARAALAVALVVVLLWPTAATVLRAFKGQDTGSRGGLLTSPASQGMTAEVPRALRLAGETIRLVVATEALTLPVGLLLAFVIFRTDARGRRLALVLLTLSAFVPMPLHATAWLGAFGNAGRARLFGLKPLLVGWSGAAFVHAAAALPWVVILAGVGLRTVEPELEESALIDLPAWRVALSVTLRRGIGAVAAAALAVAVLTAGDMTVTDLLSVRTYAEEAYIQFGLGKGPSAAAAVALPPLLFLGAFVTLGARSLLRSDPARLASAASRAKLWRLGAWRTAVGVSTGLVVAALVGLPFVSLVWHAGRVGGRASMGRLPHWSLEGLTGSLEYAWADASEPLIQSTLLGAAAATLSVALAWALAWASRGPGPWRWVTAASVALALAAPGPVAGMALFLAYRPMLALYDSPAILILAGILRTFPYALLVLWPAVRSIPVEFLDAAAVDGLGPAGIVTRVALPVTRGATVAAWGVAFVLSLGELPATNLVAPPGLMPLSVVIWLLLHNGIESRLAAIVLIMLAAVAAAGLFALASLRFLVKDEPHPRGA